MIRAQAAPRANTFAQEATLRQVGGTPQQGGSAVDGEPLATLGLVAWGGLEADGEYLTTLGIYGSVSRTNYDEALATLGIAGRGGDEAGMEYLTTMGVTG
jgi:hypothetical protein